MRFLPGEQMTERRALNRIGITDEQLNSNDPNVLRSTIEQIINSNVLGEPEFDTMSTRLASCLLGNLKNKVDCKEILT